MTQREDGGPAFPCEWDYINSNREAANGMTLRDYFAAKAMQGMLANSENDGSCEPTLRAFFTSPASAAILDDYAGMAYRLADAMLKARSA